MKNIFTEDSIPQEIRNDLSRISSIKVRQSFLALLENAWNRNNNHKNL